MHAKPFQSCPTLHNPMDCSALGSSMHGILRIRRLECIARASSRGPGIKPASFYVSCTGIGVFFTTCTTWETLLVLWEQANEWMCIHLILNVFLSYFYSSEKPAVMERNLQNSQTSSFAFRCLLLQCGKALLLNILQLLCLKGLSGPRLVLIVWKKGDIYFSVNTET